MSKLEDLEIYRLSMVISEKIWMHVVKWDLFAKDTIGKQLVKSSDSISANIAEGFGRNSLKEYKTFCYYSRGSLKETICFIEKSKNRKLISDSEFSDLLTEMEILGKKLNRFIQYLISAIQINKPH